MIELLFYLPFGSTKTGIDDMTLVRRLGGQLLVHWFFSCEIVHESEFTADVIILPVYRPLQLHSPIQIKCSASKDCSNSEESSTQFKQLRNVACGFLAVWALSSVSPVIAAGQRLPPLSTDPDRCERAFVGNTIGQANGVYDKPLDLRFCDYTNEKTNLKGKSLAAALMSDAKFDGADMTEVIMSKAYAVGASFKGTDFSNAVLDRVNFEKANLQGASFKNTVLSGSTFNNAQLDGADFEDTIIGYIDLQKICTNKTIDEEGRVNLGCR